MNVNTTTVRLRPGGVALPNFTRAPGEVHA
jgi:hypothetical protein